MNAIDWNKRPRHEVEAAAKAGDESAQSAAKIHATLDRINKQMDSIEANINRLAAAVDRIPDCMGHCDSFRGEQPQLCRRVK